MPYPCRRGCINSAANEKINFVESKLNDTILDFKNAVEKSEAKLNDAIKDFRGAIEKSEAGFKTAIEKSEAGFKTAISELRSEMRTDREALEKRLQADREMSEKRLQADRETSNARLREDRQASDSRLKWTITTLVASLGVMIALFAFYMNSLLTNVVINGGNGARQQGAPEIHAPADAQARPDETDAETEKISE